MSNNDNGNDKTKIRTPAARSATDDATRIKPVKRNSDADVPIDVTEKTHEDVTHEVTEKLITDSAGEVSQDSTRIATTQRLNEDGDKTRVAPRSAAKSATGSAARSAPAATAASDVTQFSPGSVNPGTVNHGTVNFGDVNHDIRPASDQTKIAPQQPSSNSAATNTDTSNSQSADITVGTHGVLKKRFMLEKVLGVGGMGIVYKAKDQLKVEAHDRDPYVAIKVLSDEFKSHPEAFISLQRESRKTQRIAHPNIVNVFDFDRDGDTVFMTMEFLDGSPLDQLIRQYKSTGLPSDDAWQIIKGMSAALSYAHAEKIIHSDFKPGNVFVTKKGLAKVFDFGIARAVSKVEHLEDNPEDKTIFDAGSLGALTPAYASLEMLEGSEPDIRDDIYALGCVAYELFTGVHPYNKVPADEAERQGLKPKKITNIKKYQWQAIEKAIAFRRNDRIETVDKFIEAMSPKLRTSNRFATALALLLSVVITSYFLFFQEKTIDPYSEFDIRNELELKIKIDFTREDLDELIAKPSFTDPWQDSVWKNISDLVILTKGEAPWVDEKKQQIYKLYLGEISSAIKSYKYSKAKHLIKNAGRYTEDTVELARQTAIIMAAIERDKSRKALQAKKRQQEMLTLEKKQQLKQQKQLVKNDQIKSFDVALENVNTQLKCQGRLNMRNFEAAIDKLQELDNARYRALKKSIVKSLAACISQTGKAFPERALEAKKHALRIFKSDPVLASVIIKSRDPCDKSLAGLGARGQRAVCKDKVKEAGSGPVLVVIPGNKKIRTFAIGKYEVSVAELNKFCKKSSTCKVIKGQHGEMPVSAIDFKIARSYLKWLSRQSGQKYRLPTKNEWVYAARSRRKSLDANRNCKLSTRGIQKGEELVKASIGKQNSWGLVNYVGNVQEWVYDQGRKLVAVGGSYKQSMEDCDITTVKQHDGSADRTTGLRVLRELKL